MAKGKYEKWLEKDNLLLLEAWARDGLTDEQIAKKMGINVATLYRYKKEHCEICESLKRNKEIVDVEVENTLLALAKAGNITAIIFWLKNRQPKKWREKPEMDTSDILDKLDKVIGGIDAIADK